MAACVAKATAGSKDILVRGQFDPLTPDTSVSIPAIVPLRRCVVSEAIVELVSVNFVIIMMHFDCFDPGQAIVINDSLEAGYVPIFSLCVVLSLSEHRRLFDSAFPGGLAWQTFISS